MHKPPENDPVAGRVLLFSACPDEAEDAALEKLSALLDADERGRLARQRDSEARRQFVVGHALLRVALSSLAPVPPAAWQFACNPWGQPILHRPRPAPALFFSLTHTRTLALCAVCPTCAVGVDAEWMAPGVPLADLTPQILSAEEQQQWLALAPAQQPAWFYRIWTLKEAVLKAAGRGLSVPPTSLQFDRVDDAAPRLHHCPAELGPCDAWQACVLAPAPGVAGALAVRGAASVLLQVTEQRLRLAELLARCGGA